MSSENKKLRIVGYGRESTREQAKYGFNLDDQEKKIMKYVDVYYEDGTYSMQMFREEGASAKSLDRPKMNEIMAMVRKGQVDTIVIHNLDRLTRQVKDLAVLLEEFDKNNVSLVSITEKIDTKSPMGRFFIYMIVLIAQWEWETISSRSIRGIEESARQGNYALPGAPLGYRRNPEDTHKLIIEQEEARIVKRIFESIADKQYTIGQLCAELNQQNILSRKWNTVQVGNVLSNKIYYGTFERFGVEYPDHTTPIITQDVYDRARQNLTTNTYRPQNKYLYKGLIRCKRCGIIMKCSSGKSSGVNHLYYRCRLCGSLLPEAKITDNYSYTFDLILQESQFTVEIGKCIEIYDEVAGILKKLPYSAVAYEIDESFIVDQYCSAEKEKAKLRKCLRLIKTGLRRYTFSRLGYLAKRDFLIGRVKVIEFDSKKEKMEIRFKDDDEVDEENCDDFLL